MGVGREMLFYKPFTRRKKRMISVQKRFLFVHIPKTGGNSLQGLLKKYSEDMIVSTAAHHDGIERFEVRNCNYPIKKHSTLSEYKNVLESELFDSLYKFAVIRNPYERMVSYYFSPHFSRDRWDREEFRGLVKKARTVRDYIRLQRSPPSFFFRKRRFSGDGSLDDDIDLLIKYENLEKEVESLCDRLSLEYQRLARRNSSVRCHYSEYYDRDMREMVREKFREGMEFGE